MTIALRLSSNDKWPYNARTVPSHEIHLGGGCSQKGMIAGNSDSTELRRRTLQETHWVRMPI